MQGHSIPAAQPPIFPAVPANSHTANPTSTSIQVGWTPVNPPAVDANGQTIVSYNLYLNGVFYANYPTPNFAAVTVSGLSASTTYAFQFQAVASTALVSPLTLPFYGTTLSASNPVPTLFMAPNGLDTNTGALNSPWSLSAFNNASLRTTYAGQVIGLIQGRYQYTNTGTGQVSINSQAQALPGGPGCLFQVEGNTTVVSCDASGNYLARAAFIDCHDPVTGSPVVSGTTGSGIIGQAFGVAGTPAPTTAGGVTIDGIEVSGFGYSAVLFRNLSAALPNVTVKNCHLHDNGGQVTSNNNPGAIHITGVGLGTNGFLATNNLIHGLSTQYTGTVFTENMAGIITIGCTGNTFVYNNTIYDAGMAYWNKDSTANAGRVAYNYFGYGIFGVPSGSVDGGCVRQLMTGPSQTLQFDHNICLSDARSVNESGAVENRGSVPVTNCTFYTPAGIGTNAGVSLVCAVDTTTPGNFTFQNNIVYSPNGYSVDSPAAFFVNQNKNGLTGITAASCNGNYYGNNGNGMRFQNGATDLAPAAWLALGYDAQSTFGPSPFSGTPTEGVASSFAITGPATTAGIGGTICGAIDGTVSPIGLPVGANFTAPPAINGTWWASNSPFNAVIPAGAFASPMANSSSVISTFQASGAFTGFFSTTNTFTAGLIVAPAGQPTTTWNFTYAATGSTVHTFTAIPATGAIAVELYNAVSWYTSNGDTDKSINLYSTDTGMMYDIYPGPNAQQATASFTGSVSGNTLTVSAVTGTIVTGYTLWGANVPNGVTITGGSGTTWTLSASFTAASTAMIATNGPNPISIVTASVRPLSGGGWWNQANFLTVSSGTASGCSQVGGSVKPSEWTAASIPHALTGAYASNLAGQNPNSPDAGALGTTFQGQSFIFPARGSDASAGSGSSTVNWLPEGARLQLDPSLTDAQLQAAPLSIPAAMLPVCHAMQTYGWYCLDQSATNQPIQIKFLSTNPNASTGFIGNYPNVANLPMALLAHVNWVHGPYLVGASLGTANAAMGVTVTSTGGQCAYTTNYGSGDGLVHVGDTMYVYPTYNFATNTGTGGLQGFAPAGGRGAVGWWPGVGYKVLAVGSGTFTLGTLAGAAITSTVGTMNVYFSTNAPLYDLSQAIAAGAMSS